MISNNKTHHRRTPYIRDEFHRETPVSRAACDHLEDKWYDIEDEYRTKYSELTNDDVYYDQGRFIEMLERIGKKRGKTRQQIRKEIENW